MNKTKLGRAGAVILTVAFVASVGAGCSGMRTAEYLRYGSNGYNNENAVNFFDRYNNRATDNNYRYRYDGADIYNTPVLPKVYPNNVLPKANNNPTASGFQPSMDAGVATY